MIGYGIWNKKKYFEIAKFLKFSNEEIQEHAVPQFVVLL